MPEERRRETDYQFQALTQRVEDLAEKISHKLTGIAVEQAEIKKDVAHILEQALKTNGRVNETEEDIDNLDGDHRQLRAEHDAIKNKVIGWAAGSGCVIAILIKLFWH